MHLINKYDKSMMNTAFIWSQESYSRRNKVGAIIANNGRIVVTGYNGTVSGADNCCEYQSDVLCDCSNPETCKNCLGTGYVHITKDNVLHAEMNAIAFAAKHGIATEGCTMYVTLSPCIVCANLIIQAGIKEVIYYEDYRINDGVKHLQENKIKIRKYEAPNEV